jgi:hypothetical protein
LDFRRLERKLRGDAASFERLMNLYFALTSPTDSRDWHRVDETVRKIPRHEAGEIEVRSAGKILEFRNAPLPSGS